MVSEMRFSPLMLCRSLWNTRTSDFASSKGGLIKASTNGAESSSEPQQPACSHYNARALSSISIPRTRGLHRNRRLRTSIDRSCVIFVCTPRRRCYGLQSHSKATGDALPMDVASTTTVMGVDFHVNQMLTYRNRRRFTGDESFLDVHDAQSTISRDGSDVDENDVDQLAPSHTESTRNGHKL